MDFLGILSGLGMFVALIILGPTHRISKWLFPLSVLGLVTMLAIGRNWVGVGVFLLFYGFIYFAYVRRSSR